MNASLNTGSQGSQSDTDRILILLCTYNEGDNIGPMLDRLREVAPRSAIVVVDDHSPDGTGEIVAQRAEHDPAIKLITRYERKGLGAAIRQGLQYAIENGYDLVINLDADLSHDPAAIPSMLRKCREEDYDVVVGSRYEPGGGFDGLPWHRRWISRALNTYATRVLRLPISDCSGSYRCYRVDALRRIDLNSIRCNGYGFLEEILVALLRAGCRVGQVPIVFHSRRHGQSKLRLSDALGALRVIHRLAWQGPRAH
ncbi:MAG: glycosyl transferase [Pirellulaceae bacterium]|nr:MAG: glycosyl transferase [Pirellulaceae bacterium]